MRRYLLLAAGIVLGCVAVAGTLTLLGPTRPVGSWGGDRHRLEAVLGLRDCRDGDGQPAPLITVRTEHGAVIATARSTRLLDSCLVGVALSVPTARAYHIQIGAHDGPSYPYGELVRRGWMIIDV
jgi:hypothetical protein